jgi:hypothetical protein
MKLIGAVRKSSGRERSRRDAECMVSGTDCVDDLFRQERTLALSVASGHAAACGTMMAFERTRPASLSSSRVQLGEICKASPLARPLPHSPACRRWAQATAPGPRGAISCASWRDEAMVRPGELIRWGDDAPPLSFCPRAMSRSRDLRLTALPMQASSGRGLICSLNYLADSVGKPEPDSPRSARARAYSSSAL